MEILLNLLSTYLYYCYVTADPAARSFFAKTHACSTFNWRQDGEVRSWDLRRPCFTLSVFWDSQTLESIWQEIEHMHNMQ